MLSKCILEIIKYNLRQVKMYLLMDTYLKTDRGSAVELLQRASADRRSAIE